MPLAARFPMIRQGTTINDRMFTYDNGGRSIERAKSVAPSARS